MPIEQPTLNGLLERAAGDGEAGLRFLDGSEQARWSGWSEIYQRARDVCGSLQSLGVERGARVALVYPTGPEFFHAFFGILLAGGVPVPLYPPVRLGLLEEYQRRTARMLSAVHARLVLADRRLKRILGQVIAEARPSSGCRTLEELPPGLARPVEPDPEDLGLVQFSSGTTCDPKPVALTHRALVAQATLLNGYWPDGPAVRHSGVSWLPLYHDMGLVGCIFTALERPASVTLIPPELFVARPAVWLRAISRFRATVSPAPNFAYGLCVNKIRDEEMDGVDLACWTVALNGAETVSPRVLRAFQTRFGRLGLRPQALTPVYGLSEAALAVTFSDPSRPFTSHRFDRQALSADRRARRAPGGVEIVSVGRSLPGFSLRIVDDEGSALPRGHVGHVHVKGPSMMRGYLDQPEASSRVWRGGWLDTGDLGFLHGAELFLTGRAKDVLILHGRNHAPEEVERALDRMPGIRPGCVVAVSRPEEGAEGEVLWVFAETRRGARPTDVGTLAQRCKKAILRSTGLVAERVVLLEPSSLPRTSSGKLRRQQTLARYLSEGLRPPKPFTALRAASAMARSGLAYALMKWD